MPCFFFTEFTTCRAGRGKIEMSLSLISLADYFLFIFSPREGAIFEPNRLVEGGGSCFWSLHVPWLWFISLVLFFEWCLGSFIVSFKKVDKKIEALRLVFVEWDTKVDKPNIRTRQDILLHLGGEGGCILYESQTWGKREGIFHVKMIGVCFCLVYRDSKRQNKSEIHHGQPFPVKMP